MAKYKISILGNKIKIEADGSSLPIIIEDKGALHQIILPKTFGDRCILVSDTMTLKEVTQLTLLVLAAGLEVTIVQGDMIISEAKWTPDGRLYFNC